MVTLGTEPGERIGREMEPLETLVVDDEPLARRRLVNLIAARDAVELAGEYANGLEAVAAIEREPPDLVFLDVQMPDLDGFGVVERIGPERMPAVIFVTAFEEYALDAFSVSAVDYLLKPFDDERFDAALERVVRQVRERRSAELCERLACLVAGRSPLPAEGARPTRPLRRFAVHKRGRTFLVPVGDVDWIEAAGSYVRLHAGERVLLMRESIRRLEELLDPAEFVRIHRSTMVRADRVVELRPLFHGEQEVRLADGTRLKLSRSYRERLQDLV